MTYTTNIRLDDDLAEAVKDYAAALGTRLGTRVTIADAIRILLTQALKEKP